MGAHQKIADDGSLRLPKNVFLRMNEHQLVQCGGPDTEEAGAGSS